MIRTPEWIMRMTDAEYAAWVEQGEFPERLRPVRGAARRAKKTTKENPTEGDGT